MGRETRWTREEDVALRARWGTDVPATLAERFGRSWIAVLQHAARIGLPVGGAGMQGMETLRAAVERTGYSRKALVALLRRRNVAVWSHRTTTNPEARCAWQWVDPVEVDDAIAIETRDLETPGAFARRTGVDTAALYGWLRDAGLIPAPTPGTRKHQRLATSAMERVLTARGWCAGGESIVGAARRHGLSARTLQRLLVGAGVLTAGQARRMYLDPTAVDRIVRARRAA